MPRLITVITNDDKKFKDVKGDILEQCKLIQEMLGEPDDDDNGEQQEIPLPNLTGDVFEKVLTYMNHHVDNPAKPIEKPLKSDKMAEVLEDPFDVEFIKDTPLEMDFRLLLAANYLNIDGLLDLMCGKVASRLKGLTPEQIHEKYGIVTTLTKEEEAQLLREAEWVQQELKQS